MPTASSDPGQAWWNRYVTTKFGDVIQLTNPDSAAYDRSLRVIWGGVMSTKPTALLNMTCPNTRTPVQTAHATGAVPAAS
jgi:hypothetical protein